MKIYTSQQIIEMDNLYELQDNFCSSGIPFKYQMTEGEKQWFFFIFGKYSIGDWINERLSDGEILFDDVSSLSEALNNDGCYCKAVMLSDDTALQKLFFWLSIEAI